MQIHKAAGIIIKDKKLLVEKSKNKEFFIAPGGSIEEGETPKQALIRELKEEFQLEIKEKDLEKFGVFTAEAAGHPGRTVEMDCFIVKKWTGEPTPDNEVEQILWINSNPPTNIKIGSIFEHQVLPKLIDLGLVD